MKALELAVYPLRDKVGRNARPGYVVGKRAVSTADAYRRGQAKRLTDAELAAEYNGQMCRVLTIEEGSRFGSAGPSAYRKLETLHRFATLAHYDEALGESL